MGSFIYELRKVKKQVEWLINQIQCIKKNANANQNNFVKEYYIEGISQNLVSSAMNAVNTFEVEQDEVYVIHHTYADYDITGDIRPLYKLVSKSYLFKAGKGSYGSLTDKVLTEDDFYLLSTSETESIPTIEGKQVVVEEIFVSDIDINPRDYLNQTVVSFGLETYDITDGEDYYFKITSLSKPFPRPSKTYRYVGDEGTYGIGGTPTVTEDFLLVGDNSNPSQTTISATDVVINSIVGLSAVNAQQALEEILADINNHKDRKDNPHEVTKSQIGLSNVDNTSDLDKPVSIPQQTAFDRKADLVELAPDVLLIITEGQSNEEGRVPISNATTLELQPQRHVPILNVYEQGFQPLHIGVNNESGFNQYGAEISYIKKLPQVYNSLDVRLIKFAIGNTGIDYWSNGGEGREISRLAYVNSTIKRIRDTGKNINLLFFYTQNYANSSTPQAEHLTKLQNYIAERRAEFGDNIVIVFSGHDVVGHPLNANYLTVTQNDPNLYYIDMEGRPKLDAFHFNDESIRYLGNQRFEVLSEEHKYGSRLTTAVSTQENYFVRSLQFSEVTSGNYSAIIDWEYANQYIGDIEYYIDDVLIDTISVNSASSSYEDIIVVNNTLLTTVDNLTADGLNHTIKFKNTITDYEYSYIYLAPDSSVEQNLTIDLSGVTTPNSSLPSLNNWIGTYTVEPSPSVATENGVHITGDTGGTALGGTTERGSIRLEDIPLTTQSFTLEYDMLRETNGTTDAEAWLAFKANDLVGANKFPSYIIRKRATQLFLYEGTRTGLNLIGSATFAMPAANLNEWRRYKLEVLGYDFTFSYSDDDGATYIEIFKESYTPRLTFGVLIDDLTDNPTFYNFPSFSENNISYLSQGTILLQASGSTPEKIWWKDINVTT